MRTLKTVAEQVKDMSDTLDYIYDMTEQALEGKRDMREVLLMIQGATQRAPK